MADISALAQGTTAASALSGLILVIPQLDSRLTVGYQPQNKPNADGSVSTAQPDPSILFHYEGEQTVSLESDITDHFVEDNTTIQDQIALKPVVITTQGFVGELSDVSSGFGSAALIVLKTVADKLTTLDAYVPSLSVTALLAFTEAQFAYNAAASVANSAIAAWSSIAGGGGEAIVNGLQISNVSQPSQNKQQIMFQRFFGYWVSRTLFTVQTPWAVFQNMAIKSLRAIQDPETNVITDFDVSFKQMRFAAPLVQTGTQGRAGAQSSPLVDGGEQSASESPIQFPFKSPIPAVQ